LFLMVLKYSHGLAPWFVGVDNDVG
jgi:hypothetical protein